MYIDFQKLGQCYIVLQPTTVSMCLIWNSLHSVCVWGGGVSKGGAESVTA